MMPPGNRLFHLRIATVSREKGLRVIAGETTHCNAAEDEPSRPRLAGKHVGLLLVAPALVVLSASPVEAAGPGQHFVEICSAQGVTWMALPDTGRLPYDDPGKASSHTTCAHVLRPRALLRPGRNRIRV